MINTFRATACRNKILVCFITCLTLALSSSCAQKKSAIEKLILQKPGNETERKVEEEKIRQKEAKKAVEVTGKAEKDLTQEEKPQEEKRVAVLQVKKIEEQKVGGALDPISKAISNITEKSQEAEKDRQIEDPVIEETLADVPEYMTTDLKESLAQKKTQKIPQPPVPKNIQIEKEVSLNFESTDVKDIIITFCDLLKIDYILDPGISGKITLQTFKKAKVKDLFKILEKILILNNLTVVKTGNFYRFMPVGSAKKESLNIFFGNDSSLVPARDSLIIQIIPLRHISTSSVKGIIAPLLSQHASFLDVPDTNNLIIIDTASNIKRLLGIIEIIDIEAAESLQVKLFPLKHSDAIEFAADITEIFNALGYTSAGPSRVKPKAKPKGKSRAKPKAPARNKSIDSTSVINFVPIKKINSLLVVNPFPDILPDIKFWISKLDRPIKIFIGKDAALIPDTNEQILQIVPLSFITPDSLKEIITPMMTTEGSLLSTPDQGSLIIIDFVNNIKWALEIINVLDINTLDKIQVKLIQVQYADSNEIADTLTEIFGSLGYTTQDTGSGLKFVPIERLNSLIVINPFVELFSNIESWISRLDIPAMEGLEEKIFIYYVQSTKAADLASLLSQIYQTDTLTGREMEKIKRFRTSKKEPQKAKTASKEKKAEVKAKPKKPEVRVKTIRSEEVTGEILFVADSFTNALIIKTIPKNYPAILKTIEYLDLMPLQVMIEVLVLELTIDEQTKSGLDWAFKKGDIAVGSVPSFDSLSVGAALGESATALLSRGYSFLAQTENFTALFQAFAEDSKLKVLSNPILITSENKPASINITNEIPIESSTITSTGTSDVIETTIQYRSVGIKLSITPQINRDRFVTLEISQESSNVNEAASFTQPAFFTRSTNTNVVVKDKQTLVIGGLMETTKSHSETGIPFLKDIPFIGNLFKAKSDRLRKTELIIFITPYVISNISEANQATKKFRAKLLNLKKDFKLEKQTN